MRDERCVCGLHGLGNKCRVVPLQVELSGCRRLLGKQLRATQHTFLLPFFVRLAEIGNCMQSRACNYSTHYSRMLSTSASVWELCMQLVQNKAQLFAENDMGTTKEAGGEDCKQHPHSLPQRTGYTSPQGGRVRKGGKWQGGEIDLNLLRVHELHGRHGLQRGCYRFGLLQHPFLLPFFVRFADSCNVMQSHASNYSANYSRMRVLDARACAFSARVWLFPSPLPPAPSSLSPWLCSSRAPCKNQNKNKAGNPP
eukprot:COSAG05_NODE_537_length_8855_cov_23.915829_9_plen_254_part_00